MKLLTLWLALVGAIVQSPAQLADVPLLPNGSFEEGTETPAGWACTGGGEWSTGDAHEGSRFVTVTDDRQWRSDPAAFEPGAVYELRFRYRYRPSPAAGGASVKTECPKRFTNI